MSKKTRWIITRTEGFESPGDDWEPFAVRHEYGDYYEEEDSNQGMSLYTRDEYEYVYWKKKIETEEE